jgi:hypothetical protein
MAAVAAQAAARARRAATRRARAAAGPSDRVNAKSMPIAAAAFAKPPLDAGELVHQL